MFLVAACAGDHAAAQADVLAGTTLIMLLTTLPPNSTMQRHHNDTNWALPYNNRGLARFHQATWRADADFDVAKVMDTNYVSPYVNKASRWRPTAFHEPVSSFKGGLL